MMNTDAESLAPGPGSWKEWEKAFEAVWTEHMSTVIKPQPDPNANNQYR